MAKRDTGKVEYTVDGTTYTGDYAVFVEAWQGVQPDMSLRYELSASLRPVLPSGAMCDPMQVRDRCTGAICDPTTRRCP